MTILFQTAQFILTPQDHPLLTIYFYLELTVLQENIPLPLHLFAQKFGLQYQTALSLLPLLPSNGSL